MMKYGSLFTGIGGFDLGFDRAGMECAWQVEQDRYCNTVLESHWPDVKRLRDVRDFQEEEPVDLICGGFPCQDLSVAGRRAGLGGERSSLWYEFRRILENQVPEWVVIENVPGLLSSNGRKDMLRITEELGKLGYWWAYRVLDSQYFGVAQRRRRVFIVGCLGKGSAGKVLFEQESMQGYPEPSMEEEQEHAAGARAGINECSADKAATLTGRMWKGCFTDPVNDNVIAFNCQQDPVSSVNIAPGTSGGADRAIIFAENQRGEVRKMDIFPQLSTGGGKPGQGYPAVVYYRPRRLTPLECERLQGFPDNWTDTASNTQRYKMLGNAVTVNVAEWIGRRIYERFHNV